MRKMGLEPTRCSHHKILRLARLPVPTLPHRIPINHEFILLPRKILLVLCRKTTQFRENSLTSHHLLLDPLFFSNLARKVKDFLKILYMDKKHWFWKNRNGKREKLDS